VSANLTLTDLFCGAGGSSTGAIQVPGVEVKLSGNAVTPPAARDLISCVVAAISGDVAA